MIRPPRRRGGRWPLLAALALMACQPQIPKGPDGPLDGAGLPRAPMLGAALPAGTTAYGNGSLADLFVTLTHDLEWAERRPHLIRYEAPVRVGVTGRGSAAYLPFVDGYLATLRTNTGIAIDRAAPPHNLLIRFVPGNAFRRKIPQNSCLVAPGALDWATFGDSPARHGTKAFEEQRRLEAMTVFIPDNTEPWLVRQCLIEEITQALGPANDLYGLGPSIFNDDGAHVWPTRLDYLMLRVLYAPEMRTGLNRAETARRARRVLDRINPKGRGAAPLPRIRTRVMAVWADTLRAAFDRTQTRADRLGHARRAVTLAARRAPESAYHCRSLAALVQLARDTPDEALRAAEQGQRVCTAAHGLNDIRLARLQLDAAHRLYQSGRAGAAYDATAGLEATFAAFGQEQRLTALYALQAAALRAIQRSEQSHQARKRATDWGAYALGRNHPDVRRWAQR